MVALQSTSCIPTFGTRSENYQRCGTSHLSEARLGKKLLSQGCCSCCPKKVRTRHLRFVVLALASLGTCRWDEAIEILKEALELEPKSKEIATLLRETISYRLQFAFVVFCTNPI
jgi:hypothetical protein